MAMSVDPGDGGSDRRVLSEINVTPFVDVMLVLLIIFMVTSSVDTIRAEQELEQLRQTIVEEEEIKAEEHPSQKVPVDLPKANAEKVNLAEERKIVLTMDPLLDFYIGDTLIVSCAKIAPELRRQPAARPAPKPGEPQPLDAGYRKCLDVLEQKLIDNEKLKQDQELYLRADRSIDYGQVLAVMARVRKAGINKFGLVAEADLEQ